jgi:hypothetical protein
LPRFLFSLMTRTSICGADVAVEIADGANLNLRAGQECLDADVDGQTALDAAENHALDGRLVVGGLLELVPDLVTLRLVVADEIAAFGSSRSTTTSTVSPGLNFG